MCQGICSAGPDRLTAASEMGIPQVVAPGCVDMVNFGPMSTVPEKFSDRQLFSWAPDVTLMRTNQDENRQLGKEIAEKVNVSNGPVQVLLPQKGLSIVSSKGGVFHALETDQVLFDTIKKELNYNVEVIEVPADINSTLFATEAVKQLLKMV